MSGVLLVIGAAAGMVFVAEALSVQGLAPAGRTLSQGAISPDGRLLVVLRNDGGAEIHETDGGLVGKVRGHDARIVSGSFTADGRSVLTIDAEGHAISTQLASLGVRETAEAEAVVDRARTQVWDRVLRDPATSVREMLWRWREGAVADQAANAALRAPVLPRGMSPPRAGMFRDCEDCPDMVVAPAGGFLMGSPETDADRAEDEGPQHVVTIARPFAVGRFEVTVEEFEHFAADTGHVVSGCMSDPDRDGRMTMSDKATWRSPGYDQAPRHPVVCVSWMDAKAYAAWLSQKTGERYRLLTEAEWEYVARAGSAGPYPFEAASADVCQRMNGRDTSISSAYRDIPPDLTCSDGYAFTAPAGSYLANALGVFDLHGNAAEHTADCFAPAHNPLDTMGAAFDTPRCTIRVTRGGQWVSPLADHRSAARVEIGEQRRDMLTGFRVARTITSPLAIAQNDGATLPMTGVWRGRFTYEDESSYGDGGDFKFQLVQSGEGRFSGVSIELASFGEGIGERFYEARVEGELTGDQITFVKTYTGLDGDPDHANQYAGVLSANGKSISGTWTNPGITGNFTMSRD